MTREWTVVIRCDWYLPHLVNMLKQYRGNAEQMSCATEVIEQIEAQMIPVTDDSVIATTRPLVVIDPESAPWDLSRLRTYIDAVKRDGSYPSLVEFAEWIADAIEEQTRPLKPEEPTGLGAVVEDNRGNLWIRTGDDRLAAPWFRRNTPGAPQYESWASVDAVRVLSEGVTS